MGENPEFLGAAILVFRLILHVVTALTLILFLHSERKKIIPTLIAVIGGGGSAAAFWQGIGEFNSIASATQPWIMLIVLAFAAACLYSRGNMAIIFRRPSNRWQ